MSPRLCARCHADLHTEETGELTYCPQCGAPQISLSEELREQFELQLAQPDPQQPVNTSATPSFEAPAPATDSAAVVWSSAFQLIALAGALVAALMFSSQLLPPIGLVTLLLIFGAPIILLGIYCARNPGTRITTGFGARLGLLTGLSIGIAGLAVQTVDTLVKRFVLHHGPAIDQQFSSYVAQVQAQQLAQVPADELAEMQHIYSLFNIPEFRAGFALLLFVMLLLFYAIYSTLAGAFSGALRSRTPTTR